MQNDTLANRKHEVFAQLLFVGENVDRAYIEAGYQSNAGNAYRLKGKDTIKERVRQLWEQSRVKAGVTVNSIALELDEVRRAAFHVKQYGVCATAITTKAKLYGLLVDKVVFTPTSLTKLLEEIDGETRGITNHPILDITPDKTETK